MPEWLSKILSKFSLDAPKLMWFKSESAAFTAALSQFALVWFGADISWLEGVVTTLAVYAGAYVTVKE